MNLLMVVNRDDGRHLKNIKTRKTSFFSSFMHFLKEKKWFLPLLTDNSLNFLNSPFLYRNLPLTDQGSDRTFINSLGHFYKKWSGF